MISSEEIPSGPNAHFTNLINACLSCGGLPFAFHVSISSDHVNNKGMPVFTYLLPCGYQNSVAANTGRIPEDVIF
jgi:hypothetical protein